MGRNKQIWAKQHALPSTYQPLAKGACAELCQTNTWIPWQEKPSISVYTTRKWFSLPTQSRAKEHFIASLNTQTFSFPWMSLRCYRFVCKPVRRVTVEDVFKGTQLCWCTSFCVTMATTGFFSSVLIWERAGNLAWDLMGTLVSSWEGKRKLWVWYGICPLHTTHYKGGPWAASAFLSSLCHPLAFRTTDSVLCNAWKEF